MRASNTVAWILIAIAGPACSNVSGGSGASDAPAGGAGGGSASGGGPANGSSTSSVGGGGGAPGCSEGAPCDDGIACTSEDHCQGGQCKGTLSADCGPIVQEWGTFTSVQASDGHPLGGLHHEDEALPEWVHRRNWSDPFNYYFESLPEEPLQQLETPVLYFWSPVAKQVEVAVGFPQGVVGQWFPEAASFVPAIGALTAIGNGTMTWQCTVDPSIDPSTFLPVAPDEIWAPSRNVASTPVHWEKDGLSEREQFIFYRGLGMFMPDVHVLAQPGGTLHIVNASPDTLDGVFLLRATEDSGAVVPVGTIAGRATAVVEVPSDLLAHDAYVDDARSKLGAALVASGLYVDVAQAMVDTWTRSWFDNVGVRVLYLAPRAWTDAWLPTTVKPEPAAFVRALVGRIEVTSPEEEQALVELIQQHATMGTPLDVASLGRFAEPRLRRALEMLPDPAQAAFASGLLDKAHAMP